MSIQKIVTFISAIIMVVCLLVGCYINSNQPIFEKQEDVDYNWSVEVNKNLYVLWPDQNWILFSNERGDKIGHLETAQTSLYTTLGDTNMRFLQVTEKGSDLIHMPLVRRDLAPEFVFDRIDRIEWVEWGIYTDNLQEKLGHSVVENEASVKHFISLIKDFEEEELAGDWISAGSIVCYNRELPNVMYVFDVEYNDGVLKCSGLNAASFVLISLDELKEILGYVPHLEDINL